MFKSRLFPMQKPLLFTPKALVCFLAVFVLLLPSLVLAQGDGFGLNSAANIGLAGTDLKTVIANIIRVILGFIGLILVILILYAGYIWMTAAGESDKIEKSKSILKNAIIGLIIILSAFVIVSFVLNMFNRGTGGIQTSRGTGGGDDFGRWGIGSGPIESVYPSPGQDGVAIDSAIIVTFKEAINPTTICGAENCDGSQSIVAANVEICKTDGRTECESGTDFAADQYINTKVSQTANGRTFVFVPNKFLGLEDASDRVFMVTLKNGIRSAAGEQIFTSLAGNRYFWSFTTNGKLDLNPPAVLDLVGVYPYADDQADIYQVVGQPGAKEFDLSVINLSIVSAISPAYTQPVRGGGTTIEARISGTYSGGISGETTVVIGNSGQTAAITWPDGQTNNMNVADGIGGRGLSFVPLGQPQPANSWTFSVTAGRTGDRLKVLENGAVKEVYVFGEDMAVGASLAATKTNIIQAISARSNILAACVSLVCDLKTKNTGEAVNRFELVALSGNTQTPSGAVMVTVINAGKNQEKKRVVQSQKDVFKNSVFQINFSEAINPLSVDNLTVRYDRNNDGLLETLAPENYVVTLTNQYRTIELSRQDVVAACGINSCGGQIFCWPVNEAIGLNPLDLVHKATKYEIELSAASLLFDNPRCDSLGGVNDHGRCRREIGGQTVFYPKSAYNPDGIVDMAFNSFNGSFNIYTDNGNAIGISEGHSGSGDGRSGRGTYALNAGMIKNGSLIVGYGFSTPIYDLSGSGDNFKWSFYLADEIDLQAPLIKSVSPAGEARVDNRQAEIAIKFDRLIRSQTLRPGWNYGATAKDKTTRYVVLETLENEAPVGYWVGKTDRDDNGDNLADFTTVTLNHSNFTPFANYAALVGSGVESITQNCFLASVGPEAAGKNFTGADACAYDGLNPNSLCSDNRLPNPASYGDLACDDISDANWCNVGQECRPLYDKNSTTTGGSWVITKGTASGNISPGRDNGGCCFGFCQ